MFCFGVYMDVHTLPINLILCIEICVYFRALCSDTIMANTFIPQISLAAYLPALEVFFETYIRPI